MIDFAKEFAITQAGVVAVFFSLQPEPAILLADRARIATMLKA
ncbi:hypothetical protein [Bradyrhizobium agreste]|nr:hypothetical protein [Bradyrhizobium agreste]